MKRHTTVLLLAVIGAMSAANAACPKQQVLFSCSTMKGKRVEVCDAGGTIGYTFGKAGQRPKWRSRCRVRARRHVNGKASAGT